MGNVRAIAEQLFRAVTRPDPVAASSVATRRTPVYRKKCIRRPPERGRRLRRLAPV